MITFCPLWFHIEGFLSIYCHNQDGRHAWKNYGGQLQEAAGLHAGDEQVGQDIHIDCSDTYIRDAPECLLVQDNPREADPDAESDAGEDGGESGEDRMTMITMLMLTTPGGGGQGDVPLARQLLCPRRLGNVGGIREVG